MVPRPTVAPRPTEAKRVLPNPEDVADLVMSRVVEYREKAKIRLTKEQLNELITRNVIFVLGGGVTGREWKSEHQQRFVRALNQKLLAVGLKYPNIPELDSLLK